MKHLSELKKVNLIEQVEAFTEGILYLSDNQEVLSFCEENNIPVAGYEHDDITGLKCQNILLDVEDVEDEIFENIYRRCRGIPWDIATTERTHIRELSMDDADALFALYDKPGVTQFMEPLFEYEKEVEYEKNYIEYIYKLYGFGMWLVFDKKTDELIGRAGIEVRETCVEAGQVEMGFCIDPDRWRTGLAYEVCSKIIELAFNEYGMTTIICRCDDANIASKALMTKLGFHQDGYMEDGDCKFLLFC